MPAYLGSEGVTLNAALEIENDGTVLEELIKRTISTYENPYLSEVRSHAFLYCSLLTSVNLPQVTSIGDYAFRNCGDLTSIDLPLATTIGNSAFYSCKSLTSIDLPQATTIGSNAFCYCHSLASINLPQVTTIGSAAFRYCSILLSLYLLGSSVPTLSSIDAFNFTPISGNTALTSGVYGSIYVPASLYNDYLIASNWSVYSSRIVSVGD